MFDPEPTQVAYLLVSTKISSLLEQLPSMVPEGLIIKTASGAGKVNLTLGPENVSFPVGFMVSNFVDNVVIC